MSDVTITLKDGTTIPAIFIPAAACENALRRQATNARSRRFWASMPTEERRRRWRENTRRQRARKRGAA